MLRRLGLVFYLIGCLSLLEGGDSERFVGIVCLILGFVLTGDPRKKN